jgi:hypothetical protein
MKTSEEMPTISGADRFNRRGGTCRLHAIDMNQLCIIWGCWQKLSNAGAILASSLLELQMPCPFSKGSPFWLFPVISKVAWKAQILPDIAVARPLGIAAHDHRIVGKEEHASRKGLRLF